MTLRRRSATFALALAATMATAGTAPALAATTATPAPSIAAAQPDPNHRLTALSSKIRQDVTVAGVREHLTAFQRIADANNGNRGAGSSGYEASAQYVEGRLRAAGYLVSRQYFDFMYEVVHGSSLTAGAAAVEEIPMRYSPGTDADGVTGQLVAPAIATGCDAAAWDGVDATGKIALVSRGTCSFSVKSKAAKAAGAIGVIIYNNATGALNGTLGEVSDAHAPTTGITQAAGQALLAQLAAGPVTATLTIDKTMEMRQTFNVIAETKTGNPDNIVMAGAHLDSVAEGPGINDNGSGSATILEVSENLPQQRIANKVRFAFWGAEEFGLLGSEHYVSDLVDHNPAELGRIATYLNFDMVGSPNYIIGVYDANQSTIPAPAGVNIPDGSVQTESLITGYFDSIGQPWVDTAFSGRSDYQAFIDNGIPAGGIFTGADGVKTPQEAALFGGTAGITYDPNYHTPGDNLANVNDTALDITSDGVAHAIFTLAMSTQSVNGVPSAKGPGKAQGPKAPRSSAGHLDLR